MPRFFLIPGSVQGPVAGALFALCLLCHATPAKAYEDRITLDLAAHGLLSPDLRFGAQVGGSLGLSDAWSLRAALGYEVGVQSPLAHGMRAHLDVLYLVDIVEWVPFFGLRGGAAAELGPDVAAVPFAGLVGGLDHFVSRDAIVGIDVAWTPGLRDGEVEHLLTVALRLSLLFDN